MTHDEMIELIQAHKSGKTVQYWSNSEKKWNDSDGATVFLGLLNYRVKPERKLVPWKDLRQHVGKAIQSTKSNLSGVALLVWADNDGSIAYRGGGGTVTPDDLLEDFTQYPSGEPCGEWEEA